MPPWQSLVRDGGRSVGSQFHGVAASLDVQALPTNPARLAVIVGCAIGAGGLYVTFGKPAASNVGIRLPINTSPFEFNYRNAGEAVKYDVHVASSVAGRQFDAIEIVKEQKRAGIILPAKSGRFGNPQLHY